jgi:hypothetical protein
MIVVFSQSYARSIGQEPLLMQATDDSNNAHRE